MLGRNHTEESKAKMSKGRKGENNGMFGRTHTKEARAKISAASKASMTPKRRKALSEMAKNRECSHFKGKHHSDEWKKEQAIRKYKLNREQVLEVRQMLSEGIIHRKIAEYFNVSRTVIFCISSGKTYKDYK